MTVRSRHRGNVFILPVAGDPDTPRLFCFPHAGGAASFFFDLARELAPAIECVCVQLPGRGARLGENPHFSIADMAREISDALPGEMLERPFAFYGHSFGGIIAFEVLQNLRREGRAMPLHLFVGAAPAPQHTVPRNPLHQLPEPEFIEGVQARYAGIPAAVLAEPEILRLLLPALRADLTAFETYRYQPEEPLGCAITAFAGAEDPVAGLERSRAWRPHTRAGFETVVLPGDHFFLKSGAGPLAQCLRERLACAACEGRW